MGKKQRYCKICNTKVGKGKSYCSVECKPSSIKKQRYCKTCGTKVGKGKSYCSDSCKPSTYCNRTDIIEQQKNRKCKVCKIIVGKGKSYCKKCFKERKNKKSRERYKYSEYLQNRRKKYYYENKSYFDKKAKEYQNKKDNLRKEEFKKVKIHCSDCNKFIGSRFELFGTGHGPKVPRCKDCNRLVRNKRMREYRKKPKNRLTSDVRTRVWQTLKGGKKHKSTFDALGYTPQQLMKHLEKYMEDGMNWDNYTKHGWHIDHTKPIDAFNFTSTEDEEFKKCWALSNLRPMWAEDNLKKSNKIL